MSERYTYVFLCLCRVGWYFSTSLVPSAPAFETAIIIFLKQITLQIDIYIWYLFKTPSPKAGQRPSNNQQPTLCRPISSKILPINHSSFHLVHLSILKIGRATKQASYTYIHTYIHTYIDT